MVPTAKSCVRFPCSEMARGNVANFSRRKRSFMASARGRRDAKSRAASLSASAASIDLSPIVMRTRASEAALLLMGGSAVCLAVARHNPSDCRAAGGIANHRSEIRTSSGCSGACQDRSHPCQISTLGQRMIDDMSLRNMGTRKLWGCLCPRKPIRQQSSGALPDRGCSASSAKTL
jgi:hypothetical protein